MPRVLITGATGFVGSWMTRKCPPNVEYVGGGSGFYESEMMDGLLGITHIVHLAPVDPSKVIHLAQKWGARLLYCSSGIVYHPENNTEYRKNKVNGEYKCLISDVDVVIARLFTFFGAGLDENKAITAMKQAIRDGKPLTVYDGVVRSYMHGRELGRVLWEILFQGESGQAYDVGSPRPVPLSKLARRFQAFTGCKIQRVNYDVPVPIYLPHRERLWKYSLR